MVRAITLVTHWQIAPWRTALVGHRKSATLTR